MFNMVNANRVDSVMMLSNNPAGAGTNATDEPARFVLCRTAGGGLSFKMRIVTDGDCWFASTGYKWESPP